MRYFSTLAVAGFAVAAAGSGVFADLNTRQFRGGLTPGAAENAGGPLSYSSLGIGNDPFANFSGYGFSHGSIPTFDDILNDRPGWPITEISFSVVSFNSDGSTIGGTVTTNAIIGLYNAMPNPDGSGLTVPDFTSPKAQITVTGLLVESFTASIFSVDVRELNILNKDEVMWAGLFFTGTTGPANADGTALNDNMGQGVFGTAAVGFSDDLAWDPGGLFFFGGAGAGNPYTNFGWEFGTIPTPGAMAILGFAGLGAMRCRR